MASFEESERERSSLEWDSRIVGSKNPNVSVKGYTRLETSRLDAYRFVLNMDDLTNIRVLYRVSGEFNLGLPNLMHG